MSGLVRFAKASALKHRGSNYGPRPQTVRSRSLPASDVSRHSKSARFPQSVQSIQRCTPRAILVVSLGTSAWKLRSRVTTLSWLERLRCSFMPSACRDVVSAWASSAQPYPHAKRPQHLLSTFRIQHPKFWPSASFGGPDLWRRLEIMLPPVHPG